MTLMDRRSRRNVVSQSLNDRGTYEKKPFEVNGVALSKSKEVPIEPNGDEPFQDDQKPRKRGRTAIEKVADTEPETRRGRGLSRKSNAFDENGKGRKTK
jgi:hypothetical protein